MSNLTMNITSSTASRPPSSRLRLFTLSCLPVLLAACGTVTPVAFTQDEIKGRVAKDREVIYADQEPVSGPIGFHEASAHKVSRAGASRLLTAAGRRIIQAKNMPPTQIRAARVCRA